MPKNALHDYKHAQAGFTLLEMLVAVIIMTLFIGILYPVFDQAEHASQESETQARLQELAKGVKVAYAKDAMVVDSTLANGALVFTATHSQTLGNQINTTVLSSGTETVTPTQAYPLGQPQNVQTGFDAIAGAAGNSAIHLATDGFDHPVWVYVSPQIQTTYDGYPLYFHDVAFLSTNGAPNSVTPTSQGVTYTCEANSTTEHYGCAFNMGTNGGQHDLTVNVSGYAIEAHLYKTTLERMKTVADAYGSYFTTQYLANVNRNVDIDYFANVDTAWDGCGPPNGQGGNGNAYMDSSSNIPNSGNGSNGGTGWGFPGPLPDGDLVSYYQSGQLITDVQPATWDNSAFISNLGLSLPSVTSAWGFLLGVGNGPNVGNNANSVNGNNQNLLNRSPLSCTASLESPPYTAFIFAWAPGGVLLSKSIVGTY